MLKNHDALDWTAFCYVADELSDADRAEFERRLASDQAAREALAKAVELTQATHVALAQQSACHPSRTEYSHTWLPRLAWMSLGAALCLAFMVVSSLRERTDNGSDNVYSPALLSAWSEARESVQQQGGLPDRDSSANSVLAESTDESPAAPSWMLAAVEKDKLETEE